MKTFEKRFLMDKKIEFEAKDSKEFGQLIVKTIEHLKIKNYSGKLIKAFKGHRDWVHCTEQIEDFSKIITCCSGGLIKIWSTESGECLKTLTEHTNRVEGLIVSNDKKYLISGSSDKTIRVWNIENDFECVQTLQQEGSVTSLCLLPNNILVCGLNNGKITKWNLNDFTKIDSFEAHEDCIWCLKHFSSSQIASCSLDKIIKLWNLETNECLRTFTGHTESVNSLEISFDKSNLYSGSTDSTVRVWDISSGECLNSINLNAIVFCLKLLSPNFIAVGLSETKENLKIIDWNSLQTVKSCKIPSQAVTCLNFDSEKNVLFNGSDSGSVSMRQL
jgi:WD40 repeat protein